MSLSEKSYKRSYKFFSKVCHKSENKKLPLQISKVDKLYNEILKLGGISSLTFVEFRTFVTIVFSHQTLCRTSEAHSIKLSDIEYAMYSRI